MAFIVIEGPDGSGKSTQIEVLEKALNNDGIVYKKIHFPQYDKPSSSPIKEYLNGYYGNPKEVNPYQASLLYAVDRFDGKFTIEKWLNEGNVVFADRYVASNMGHQGGKIDSQEEREKYYEWLLNLEYNLFKIPKPDVTIILLIPPEKGQELIAKKRERDYIKIGRHDVHEKDIEHMTKATQVYSEISRYPGFVAVSCVDEKGEIRSIEDIHNEIYSIVKKYL